jgi:hypothetical protein
MAKGHDLPLSYNASSQEIGSARYAISIVYRYNNKPMRVVTVRLEEYSGSANNTSTYSITKDKATNPKLCASKWTADT